MDAVRKAEAIDAVTDPDQGDPFMSISEAARQLKKERPTILSLIVKGELRGGKAADRPVVTRESVEAYKVKYGITNEARVAPEDGLEG